MVINLDHTFSHTKQQQQRNLPMKMPRINATTPMVNTANSVGDTAAMFLFFFFLSKFGFHLKHRGKWWNSLITKKKSKKKQNKHTYTHP